MTLPSERRSAGRYHVTLACRVAGIDEEDLTSAVGCLHEVSVHGAVVSCGREVPVASLVALSFADARLNTLWGQVTRRFDEQEIRWLYAVRWIYGDLDYASFELLAFGEPEAPREIPDCIADLGLDWPCSAAEVRAAYLRLAKTLHPDAGGTHQAFDRLQQVHQQALKLLESD